MTARFVLDSYALLAYLGGEDAGTRVRELLASGERGECDLFLSYVNYGEVVYITERRGGLESAKQTIALVDNLPIYMVTADRRDTFDAAHIKANHALAYADAFAAALAETLEATLVTGDTEFESVATRIDIEWLPVPTGT